LTRSKFSTNIGFASSIVACASSTFLFAFVRRSFCVSASISVDIPPGVDDVGCIDLPPVALTMSKAFFLSSIA